MLCMWVSSCAICHKWGLLEGLQGALYEKSQWYFFVNAALQEKTKDKP